MDGLFRLNLQLSSPPDHFYIKCSNNGKDELSHIGDFICDFVVLLSLRPTHTGNWVKSIHCVIPNKWLCNGTLYSWTILSIPVLQWNLAITIPDITITSGINDLELGPCYFCLHFNDLSFITIIVTIPGPLQLICMWYRYKLLTADSKWAKNHRSWTLRQMLPIVWRQRCE